MNTASSANQYSDVRAPSLRHIYLLLRLILLSNAGGVYAWHKRCEPAEQAADPPTTPCWARRPTSKDCKQ